MALKKISFDFTSGRIEVEPEGQRFVVKVPSTFTPNDEDRALDIIDSMMPRIGYRVEHQEPVEEYDAVAKRVSVLAVEIATDVKRNPNVQVKNVNYRILPRKYDYEGGTTYTLELTTNTLLMEGSAPERISEVLRERYDLDDIYYVYSTKNSTERTLVFGIGINAESIMNNKEIPVATDISQSFRLATWELRAHTGKTVVFARVRKIGMDNSWNPSIAKAVLGMHFDVNNILFIHPTKPMVVCNFK